MIFAFSEPELTKHVPASSLTILLVLLVGGRVFGLWQIVLP